MTTARPNAPSRRWLFLDGSPQFGGHEVMLLRLLEELDRQGQVTSRVLSRAGTMLQSKTTPRYATPRSLPRAPTHPTGWARIFHYLREARVCLEVLRAEAPELCIVVDGCLLAQPFLTALCWLTGRRLAIYVPIPDPTASLGFRTGRARDFLVRHAFGNLPDAWITLTAEQATSFARWAGVARPIFLLPNTVAPRIEALSAAPTPNVSLAEQKVQRILVLGRLDAHQKGLDLLLEYLAGAGGDTACFAITIAGDGPAREMIAKAVASSASVARAVTLASWSDPIELLRAHDVLLLPSRFEGVPLVMLEAMALGVPVIASDLPGTRQFLTSESLFPIGDFGRAFALVARLRDASTRAAVVRRNQTAFAIQASGAAFAAAVTKLTRELSDVRATPFPTATSAHA